MRILNVTETYAPFFEFGGPPVKVLALAEGLARHGHTVGVVTADWGLEKRLRLQSEAELQAAGWDRSPFGWRHNQYGVQSIYIPSWWRYRAVSWNPAIDRYCRARLQNFDVVHIFGLYDLLGPAVASAARELRIPYVIEPIGMFVPIVRNVMLKRMYHALIGRRLFADAAAVIATSEQEVSELATAGVPRDKIVLRRNGVDLPPSLPPRGKFRAAQGIAERAKLVLFLGRLSPKKSPELLLQAFAQFTQQHMGDANPMLVFAGPDDAGMHQRLAAEAARLGLSTRVKFNGPLFGEDKWSAYRDADVFVLPSQNENFGNTAAESMAAGTPVIVTEQCGIAAHVKDLAGEVVAHDAKALADALEKILTDANHHAALAAGCAQVTASLGWEQPVSEMENLYAAIAGDSAASATSGSRLVE